MEDEIGQGLGYRTQLALRWEPVTAPATAVWVEQNLRVLAAIAALDERPRTDPQVDGAAEFERLHHKFDVMIELLGALLRQQQAAPAVLPVWLGAHGMTWPVTPAPTIGSTIQVELYLHRSVPLAWIWAGTVETWREGELVLRFLPMPAALAAALERHVFTHHRRSVADARSPGRPGRAPAAF